MILIRHIICITLPLLLKTIINSRTKTKLFFLNQQGTDIISLILREHIKILCQSAHFLKGMKSNWKTFKCFPCLQASFCFFSHLDFACKWNRPGSGDDKDGCLEGSLCLKLINTSSWWPHAS